MFYSLVQDTKSTMVGFLKFLFFENAKGRLKFTNGTRRVEFSTVPVKVIEAYQWKFQEHPVVLIDTAVGNMHQLSVAADFLDTIVEDGTTFFVFGGDSTLTVTLTCIAKTKEERDNLVDIVAIYLSRPDAKQFFLKNGMDIPNPVAITGEAVLESPNTDFKLYSTDLTLDVHVQWEELFDAGITLADIQINLTFDDDPPEGRETLGE